MPPKKDEIPAAPRPDTNPFGAFIKVTVASAQLELVAVDASAAPAPAKVLLVLSYPGEFAPLRSEPVGADPNGTFAFNFSQAFRQGTTPDTLHNLINSTVRISVMDAGSSTVLASASLDMAPLALGSSGFELQSLTMDVVEDVGAVSAFKAVQGTFPAVSVSLAVRFPPEGMSADEAAAAAAAAPDEALPEAMPWRYIPEDEIEECNVVELVISGWGAVPPGLQAASDSAREGKTPGRINVSIALVLPDGCPPVVVADNAVHPGGLLAVGARARRCISREQASLLKDHLEDGLPLRLEVARYLVHDTLADPAWEHYHAAGSMTGGADETGALLAMGSTARHEEQVPLAAFASSGAERSVLPPYTIANPKAKCIEEAPAAGPATAPGAWHLVGSAISLSVSMLRPLVAVWKTPAKPAAPLGSLVQFRAGLTRYVPPGGAMEAYRRLVSEMGGAVRKMALEGAVSAADGGESTVPSARALSTELQGTGRYAAMREAIAEAAVRVALERYGKLHDAGVQAGDGADGPTADQVAQLHEELHAVLTEELAASFASAAAASAGVVAATSAAGAGAPSTAAAALELARLITLAAQCEQAGLTGRAEALHQRRLLQLAGADAAASAAAWQEYGAFCMRTGQHGRGEQCFREGVTLERATGSTAAGAAPGCGLALAAALLHQARATDPLFLEEAERQLAEVLPAAAAVGGLGGDGGEEPSSPQGRSAFALVLSALIHGAAGRSGAVSEVVSGLEQLEASLVEQGGVGAAASGTHNPCLVAATAFLQLGLPWLSLSALALADQMPLTGKALEQEIQLARAQAMGRVGDAESESEALSLLRDLAAAAAGKAGPAGVGAAAEEEQGHIHYKAGRHTEAVHSYRAAQEAPRPPGSPGFSSQLYLQLAQSYTVLRHPDWALQVYIQACSVAPSASAWLGVGACRTALEEYDAAGQALSEAALLDPENPSVWGRIALVGCRAGRDQEAAAALKCAIRLGLEDASLLAELGREFSGRGSDRAAENLVRQAASRRPEDMQIQELLSQLNAQRLGTVGGDE